jgi:RpiB/LacA/LacB family sugar-phosphate isomerase
MRKICIGSDHAGFLLKEKVKGWLEQKKIPFVDLGNLKLDPRDDYPDFAAAVARLAVKQKTKGILFCGSAEGVCIAANKIKGARAVNPSTVKLAKLSREHNDANILCLSGWFGDPSTSKRMITIFLKTPFSKALRHRRRVDKIKKMEN